MMILLKQNIRLVAILTVATSILLIPLLAMNFSDEVNWSGMDFLVAGILLFGTGIAIEFVIRKITTKQYRILMIVSVLVALILVWMELAVGIFGTPLAGS